LTPEDDYTHEVGPDENFNESVYFNFFDHKQIRGGFVRIGNPAKCGYAETTVIVCRPEGSALLNIPNQTVVALPCSFLSMRLDSNGCI